MVDPKPCPFCGCTDAIVQGIATSDGRHDGSAVFCHDCGAQGPIADEAEAVAAWNKLSPKAGESAPDPSEISALIATPAGARLVELLSSVCAFATDIEDEDALCCIVCTGWDSEDCPTCEARRVLVSAAHKLASTNNQLPGPVDWTQIDLDGDDVDAQ